MNSSHAARPQVAAQHQAVMSVDSNALNASGAGLGMAIQVLERATALLDALAAQPEPVALKDLSKATGLHSSTAHRILNDLVLGRYVDRVDSGLYQLVHKQVSSLRP